MLIGILITTFGVLGGIVTIFSVFIQVKNPIKVTKKDIGFITLWLILMALGIANLYYIHIIKNNDNNINDSQQSNGIQETSISHDNEEESSEERKDTNDADSNISEKKLINQNFDLIQQLKAEYSYKDTEVINNDTIYFWLDERAGYVFPNLKETERYYELDGVDVLPNKVIILDYFSDEIIYSFTPEKGGSIKYSPGDDNIFYCIVFHDDYEIFVTPPISLVGGKSDSSMQIYLNTKDDEYTPLFRIRLYIRNLNLEDSYSVISEDYIIKIQYRDVVSRNNSPEYYMELSEFGILSYYGFTYFSLNIDYEMFISLYRKTDDRSELVAQEVVNTTADSNLIDIYFDLGYENNTLE